MRWLRARVARRRLRGDDGVALVELAFVAPVLILLSMGIWEFAQAWQTNLKVQSAVRSAGRTASSLGTDRLADYYALQAAQSGLSGVTIQTVVIFKSTTADGAVPSACLQGPANSPGTDVSGVCNAYTASDVSTLTSSNFSGTTSCDSTAPDRFWCPLGRDDSLTNSEYLGVYVQAFHRYVSNWFPGTGITIKQTAVFKIEPNVN